MIIYHVVFQFFLNINYISKYRLSPPKSYPPKPPPKQTLNDQNWCSLIFISGRLSWAGLIRLMWKLDQSSKQTALEASLQVFQLNLLVIKCY